MVTLKKKLPLNFLAGIPVFAQWTIYHMCTEMRLVYVVCVSSCSLNPACDILVPSCISTSVMVPYQIAKMLH